MREEKKPNSQSISRRRRSPVRASGGADLQSELQAARSREDRDLTPSRHRDLRSRSRDHAIASSRLRSRSTARSRAVARSRSRAVDREIAPARSRSQIAIVDGIFLGFVFSFFFSKHQKIFSGKFFEMQPNMEKYFPFPENILRQPNTALAFI